jgi:hypothetical protein
MKTIVITIVLLLAATCTLAQKTVTVWGPNGQATIYQVYPNGQVTGITPGTSGMVYGNLNDGNLYDGRLPNNSLGGGQVPSSSPPANYQKMMDNLYGNLPR